MLESRELVAVSENLDTYTTSALESTICEIADSQQKHPKFTTEQIKRLILSLQIILKAMNEGSKHV